MTDRGAGATGGDPGAAGTRHEFLVEADDNVRLDLLVAARLGLSRTQAATLIANRAVSVEGRAERASYRAQRGETVVVTVPPPVTPSIVGEQIPLDALRYWCAQRQEAYATAEISTRRHLEG